LESLFLFKVKRYGLRKKSAQSFSSKLTLFTEKIKLKRMMNSMKNYKTKDFYLAALLMSKGFKLIGSEKQTHAVFFEIEYDNEEKLQKLINDFVNFEAYVNLGKLVKMQALLRRELDKYRK
jgi:hypothetical protein